MTEQIIAISIGAGVIIIMAVVYLATDRTISRVQVIVVGASMLALATALSFIKIFPSLPFGGSVTLVSTLPIMLFGFVTNIRKSIFIGLVFSVIQLVSSTVYFLNLAQFLLDYIIGFMMLGVGNAIIRLNAQRKVANVILFAVGASISSLIRYACSVLSGIVFFSENAPTDFMFGVVGFSLAYNAVLLIDSLIAIVAGCILVAIPSVKKEFVILQKKLN